MSCTARVVRGLVLAASLGAAAPEAEAGSNVPLLEYLDWLHVPKTGTSFGMALLMYRCEYLEKSLRSSLSGKMGKSIHKVKGHMQWDKNGSNITCLEHHGHEPLRSAAKMGHKGYSVGKVVTMLRSPVSRVISGFVHNMHNCFVGNGFVAEFKKSERKADPHFCKALIAGPEASGYEAASNLVLSYGHCVRGCVTRMVTGNQCGHDVFEEDSAKAAASRLEKAMTKLDQFGFVGLTERWAESMCLFSKLFPRASGRPYPDFVVYQLRPTKDRRCEEAAEQVLRSSNYTDPWDEAIYAHGVELFERAIARHPECKA